MARPTPPVALAVATHIGLGLAIVVGIAAPWSVLVVLNLRLSPTVPWSLPTGLIYLFLMAGYLNGRGWPLSTSEVRRRHFRALVPPPAAFLSALLAGFAGVTALWLGFAATGDLLAQHSQRSQSNLPPVFLFGAIILGAAVTALAEEAGLRGFMQAPLEVLVGPVPAICTTSLVFVLIHLSHEVSALARAGPFYLAAGCIYGLLAYLSQSILPSLLLHFLGDLLLFGLRSSVVRLGGQLSRISATPLLLAALVATLASVIAFVILARLTAGKRPPLGKAGVAV
jgi:membrane protease YdiL (CAAX protease family)